MVAECSGEDEWTGGLRHSPPERAAAGPDPSGALGLGWSFRLYLPETTTWTSNWMCVAIGCSLGMGYELEQGSLLG